ncbi:MAG TPA: adenylate/guanylate cyclase domain-containing protein [Haliangiales bacterium]|nr:adenylate/guanylate cyclase domain-containing protein [Haliangiales bacterium]
MKPQSQFSFTPNIPILIAAGVIALVCLVQALPRSLPGFDMFQRLEWMTYDWRVRRAVSSPSQVATNLGVVFIDDDSLKTINDNYQFSWPWPRQLYGRLIGELSAEGAKAIGFDILFRELHPPSPDTALRIRGQTIHSDDYFALQMRQTSNVVLAVMDEKMGGQWRALLPADKFRTNAWMLGHITSDVDSDGVLRRAKPYYDDPVRGRFWHMGIVLASRALKLDLTNALIAPGRIVLRGEGGVERSIPVDGSGFFYIDWSLPWNGIPNDSFEDMLQKDIARDNGKTNIPPAWKDKIVVIGSLGSGNNISDIGATPISKQTYLVSKHWNVANSVISGRFIRRSSYATELLLILLMGAVSALLTWKMRALQSALLVGLTVALYVSAAVFLFSHYRYWLPLVLPAGCALGMTHVCMITYRVRVEQKERRRIRSVFSKIVSPDVVNVLLKAKQVALGGARRNVTVYFADIRGFTRMTDEIQVEGDEYIRQNKLPPASAEAYLDKQAGDLLATVSLYLSVIADTIKKHHGTLDKYIGDCVLAFWGAPIPNDRHALDCVLAAIDAQRTIYDLNLRRAAENKRREQENAARMAAGQPLLPMLRLLALGSGINTGTVMVGLMGSDAHFLNYTVLGREVNLASRLEGVSGRGRIIISDATCREIQRLDPELASTCVELPPQEVKGFRDAVKIYEVHWQRTANELPPRDAGISIGPKAVSPADIIASTRQPG